MRILLHGINYSPELTGIGKYTGEMAPWLAAQGHDVTVITALPYYPEWQVHEKHRGKFWHIENITGVEVYRCPLYVPEEVTSVKRILHEFSFLFSTLPVWFAKLFEQKYDVVICVSPPFHLGFLPLLYARLKGAKFINHIQDLQVDAAKELGMIKNEQFLNVMFSAEKYIFDKADVVSTISEGMLQKVIAKGIPENKTLLFPNWVDEAVVRPLPPEASMRGELGIPLTDRVILYSGNLGEKQGLEIIVDAAKHFASRPDVHFIIAGSGGGKERLKKLIEEAGLRNILLLPLQPLEKLSALLSTADLHLVLQKKSASDLVMPSKLTGILAAGGCAIASAVPGTSLYNVVLQHQMGFIIEPESSVALIEGISMALATDLTPFKARARHYASEYLSKTSILQNFENQLRKIIFDRKF